MYRCTVIPTSSHPVIGWCETLIRGIGTGSIGVRGDTGGQVGCIGVQSYRLPLTLLLAGVRPS